MVVYIKDGKEKNNSLCSFVPGGCYCCSLLGVMGACLLNKHREWRQNAVRMRVKRLQEMIEGKYACRLSGVMECSDQRVYEYNQDLEFYDFRDMSNEINLLLFLSFFI